MPSMTCFILIILLFNIRQKCFRTYTNIKHHDLLHTNLYQHKTEVFEMAKSLKHHD